MCYQNNKLYIVCGWCLASKGGPQKKLNHIHSMNKCAGCKIFNNCFASTLSKSDLLEFEKEKKILTLKKGEIIYVEKKSANRIFSLLSGTVKLEHNYNLTNPMIIRIIHQGEFFGLESLLTIAAICIQQFQWVTQYAVRFQKLTLKSFFLSIKIFVLLC